MDGNIVVVDLGGLSINWDKYPVLTPLNLNIDEATKLSNEKNSSLFYLINNFNQKNFLEINEIKDNVVSRFTKKQRGLLSNFMPLIFGWGGNTYCGQYFCSISNNDTHYGRKVKSRLGEKLVSNIVLSPEKILDTYLSHVENKIKSTNYEILGRIISLPPKKSFVTPTIISEKDIDLSRIPK